MAQRRMISKEIHQSGAFLNLPSTTKILYDDLVLYADDDGFCTDFAMVNLMDKPTDEDYKKLEDNNLIIKLENAYLIVDWLNTEQLTHYKRTSLLNLSARVFIRTDFRYTIDPTDENIALSLDDWVETKNRSRKINLKSLQQQRLNAMVNKKDTTGKHNVNINNTKGSPSIDKNSIDESRLEQYSRGQSNKEENSKENNYKYINSSSNGGMGEDASLAAHVATSSIENNATKESGRDSGLPSGDNGVVNSQPDINDNQDSINSLFNYLNGISTTDIPKDNKRLADVFNMLIHNGYEIEDIQLGIDNIMNVANQMPQYQDKQSLAKLLIQHLPEYTKQTLEQSSSND